MKYIWFNWIKAILNTCDNSDGYIKLFHEGVEVAFIEPQTKDYWTIKDVVHELEWEEYPEPSGYDKNGKPYYLLWYGDVAIIFDDFEEGWI